MINNSFTQPFKLALLLGGIALLSGCSNVSYYSQSIVGHSRLMLARQPVDNVIKNADDALKSKLLLSKQLRAFAVEELGLPRSNSYKTYVALEREYPVWTVVAAPEFSLSAKLWCYPVIGCASYRGYFSESAANAYAAKLRAKGFETEVGGAPAYSTLGWFADPLLPSMMRHGDASFAETLFHEIAHQRLYVNGDSDFNEAFASVVGEVGVLRWLAQFRPHAIGQYKQQMNVREQFYELVSKVKQRLHIVYESDALKAEMAAKKNRVLNDLLAEYQELKHNEWDGKAWFQAWFKEQPNNAKFAALSTYRDRMPELRALLNQCDDNLSKFYQVLSTAEKFENRVVIPKQCMEHKPLL